ncbi:universal stress protein [Listeria sp. PSOL-1]|uniref:universal stress protein n=1 Tax=Listeria sp. PSOL-1 TaxID=1844999 RepID=UPI0013D46893|nr:universal stress protein [Listeria sp. PSOL-1]
MENYKQILVAIDGSTQADKAFQQALDLAGKYQATLGIASIVDLRSFSPNVSYDGTLEKEAMERVTTQIKEYVNQAEKAGVPEVKTYVESGNPKRLLAKEIPEKFEADLIIVGATGMNRVERVVLGSVSSYILARAMVDVLIAR